MYISHLAPVVCCSRTKCSPHASAAETAICIAPHSDISLYLHIHIYTRCIPLSPGSGCVLQSYHIYIYIYVYMYISIYLSIYLTIYMYLHLSICIYIYILDVYPSPGSGWVLQSYHVLPTRICSRVGDLSMYICLFIYIHICIHTYIHTYTYTYMYTYICMYVCIYTYIYTYIYIYIAPHCYMHL